MMTRIYPIRLTRQYWDIPIHSHHICTVRCQHVFQQCENDRYMYRLVRNSAYNVEEKRCSKSGILERDFISIGEFNVENPSGMSGNLYNSDSIVIPDTSFKLHIDYPLSNTVEFNIQAQNSSGFMFKEVIFAIQKVYQYIYDEEERTATPTLYKVKQSCGNCASVQLDAYITKVDVSGDVDKDCSICYNGYNSDAYRLMCGHIYHKKCIGKWSETSKTCPLCRALMYVCDICNGRGYVYYDYNEVVIPLEHRGNIINRNMTDGVFGIYGHDMGDLIIEGLWYNRIEKRLYMDIGS